MLLGAKSVATVSWPARTKAGYTELPSMPAAPVTRIFTSPNPGAPQSDPAPPVRCPSHSPPKKERPNAIVPVGSGDGPRTLKPHAPRQSGHLVGSGLGLLQGIYSVAFGMGAAVSGIFGLPPAKFALAGLGLGVAAVVIVVAFTKRGYRPDPLAGRGDRRLGRRADPAGDLPRAIQRRLWWPFCVRLRRCRSCMARDRRDRWRAPPRNRVAPIVAAILLEPMVLGVMR
jgi:hypothetical protein